MKKLYLAILTLSSFGLQAMESDIVPGYDEPTEFGMGEETDVVSIQPASKASQAVAAETEENVEEEIQTGEQFYYQ